MRVVLQHNVDPEGGLLNGSQGEIIGFEDYDENRLPTKSHDEGSGGSIVGSHATYRQHGTR
jgi:ATP-dependent DNA helicase PIF1